MDILISTAQARVPVTVFRIRGEISAATADQLYESAERAYLAGTCNLLLELAEVPFVSSAGLRAVHRLYMLLRGDSAAEGDQAVQRGLRDGSFKAPHFQLLNPTPDVREVLKVSGFDMFLEIHSDLERAVASF
jgi:anti-anti-sigma regulatory factor